MIIHSRNIQPVSKPRMTQRDKWKKRPCVVRYRHYCDQLRAEFSSELEGIDVVGVNCWFEIPMPKSWSIKKRNALRGQLHRQKPDKDNLEKAVLDALFKDDSGISFGFTLKSWADTPRVHLQFFTELPSPQPFTPSTK